MIKTYFQKWFIPLIVFALGIIIYSINLAFPHKLFDPIAQWILVIVSVGLLIAGIRKLIKKEYLSGIIQIASLLIAGSVLLLASVIIFMFGPSRDFFAVDLKIPANIIISEPVEYYLRAQLTDTTGNFPSENLRFELYNDNQPGLYKYDLWINSNESGTAYLKAYEITKNRELSSGSLLKRSSVRIEETNDSIVCFGTKDHFTIYEGDWDQPYAARFEVWFKPDNGGDERKITERNYIIEGWQR